MNAYIDVDQIKASYAPYDRHPAFATGYADAISGRRPQELDGVAGQACDRGHEAATRVLRAQRWIEENVGLD